jgi:hypothetical protein
MGDPYPEVGNALRAALSCSDASKAAEQVAASLREGSESNPVIMATMLKRLLQHHVEAALAQGARVSMFSPAGQDRTGALDLLLMVRCMTDHFHADLNL